MARYCACRGRDWPRGASKLDRCRPRSAPAFIAGVIVTDHREPYGYFSVDLPDWPKQFVGKSIKDAFKVGTDVDAISRATISVTSASRAIRNSSRKIARAYLAPPAPPAGAAASGAAAPAAAAQ
jgi:hypothetical protein